MLDEYRTFLTSCGLRDEEDADYIAWMTDDYGELTATGAVAGHTIKQLAVAADAEGQGLMAAVVSSLISEAAARGVFRLFLCTRPANHSMFRSMGFHEVIATDEALLMENRQGGADAFIASIPRHKGVCGAVVCNCDPYTLGHRHLIEYAAGRCDSLYVFAVSESGSMFSPEERMEMIRKGTADIPNCYVYASDLYLISRATFPAYFIKDKAHAESVKADLDIEFFSGRLAPALGITKRFVGQEPADPVTRAYNDRMKELLPQRGISLEEIPRLTDASGQVISAGRVRALLREAAGAHDADHPHNACDTQDIRSDGDVRADGDAGIPEQIWSMVPETTYEIIKTKI